MSQNITLSIKKKTFQNVNTLHSFTGHTKSADGADWTNRPQFAQPIMWDKVLIVKLQVLSIKGGLFFFFPKAFERERLLQADIVNKSFTEKVRLQGDFPIIGHLGISRVEGEGLSITISLFILSRDFFMLNFISEVDTLVFVILICIEFRKSW